MLNQRVLSQALILLPLLLACKSTSKGKSENPELPLMEATQAVAFDFKGAAAIANKLTDGVPAAVTLDAKGNVLKDIQINFGSLVIKASRVKLLGDGDISLIAEQFAGNDFAKLAPIDLPLPNGQRLTADCGQYVRITPSTQRIRCLLGDKSKLGLIDGPAFKEQATDPMGNLFSTGKEGNILKIAVDGTSETILDAGLESRMETGSASGLLYYTADLKTGKVALIDEKAHSRQHFAVEQYMGLVGNNFIFMDPTTSKIKLYGAALAETVINPVASTVLRENGTGVSGADGQTIAALLSKGGIATIDLTTSTYSVAAGSLNDTIDDGVFLGKAAFIYHSKSGKVYLRKQSSASDALLADGLTLFSKMSRVGDRIMFSSGDAANPLLVVVDLSTGSLSKVSVSSRFGDIQAL